MWDPISFKSRRETNDSSRATVCAQDISSPKQFRASMFRGSLSNFLLLVVLAIPVRRVSSASLFSSSLRFAPGDLNDFLSPEEQCILPLKGAMQASSGSKSTSKKPRNQNKILDNSKDTIPRGQNATIQNEKLVKRHKQNASEQVHVEPNLPQPGSKQPSKKAKNSSSVVATLSLSDCLKCSGCVTSSEEILLDKHSSQFLQTMLGDPAVMVVVSLSPQACSSIAESWGVSVSDASRRLCSFLKSLGVAYVFSTSASNDIALREACEEFEKRWKKAKAEEDPSGKTLLPVLCSECPGITVYLEKTQKKRVVRLLSKVKSPQAIASSIVKRLVEPRQGSKTWHCTVMPCLDKKLESARPELSSPQGGQETDCVLTAAELVRLMLDKNVSMHTLTPTPLDSLTALLSGDMVVHSNSTAPHAISEDDEQMAVAPGGYSGGYLEAVARYASKKLLGLTLPAQLTYQQSERGKDLRELTIKGVNPDGQPTQLRFAAVYGFRHLQNLLSNIQDGSCAYDYVEVMSCPGGCTNGGGQVKTSANWELKAVNQAYDNTPKISSRIKEIADVAIKALEEQDAGRDVLRTSFKVREMPLTAQLREW